MRLGFPWTVAKSDGSAMRACGRSLLTAALWSVVERRPLLKYETRKAITDGSQKPRLKAGVYCIPLTGYRWLVPRIGAADAIPITERATVGGPHGPAVDPWTRRFFADDYTLISGGLLYYGCVAFNDDILRVRKGCLTHRGDRGDNQLQRHHILLSVAAGQPFTAGISGAELRHRPRVG